MVLVVVLHGVGLFWSSSWIGFKYFHVWGLTVFFFFFSERILWLDDVTNGLCLLKQRKGSVEWMF